MDHLFKNVTAVTMDPGRPVIKNAYLGITGDKITYLDTVMPEEKAGCVHTGARMVVMPGLVNAHTHIAMTAMRGWADDYKLNTWLFEHIFPAEAKLDAKAVSLASRVGIMEALASGTTGICEMYYFIPSIAAEAAALGIRCDITNAALALSDEYDPYKDRCDAEIRQVAENYKNDLLVNAWCGVHCAHNTNPRTWEWACDIASQYGLRMTTHLSETREDIDTCVQKFGCTPARLLEKAGILNFPTVAAHGVWPQDGEMEIIKNHGVTIASCPVSNLKLASGIAPLTEYDKAGVNVALGTDGVASNNSHDMFEEIKLAALLQKYTYRDASAMKAARVLEMATVGGSAALGRKDQCGRLTVGRDADIIMLDFDKPHLTPCYDTVSNLVYSARGSDVKLTMCRGRVVYENGEYPGFDMEEAMAKLREYVPALISK